MPTQTPLTDAINALTTYANTVTSASDTTLSDAVATLAAGYGGGGSDPWHLKTGNEIVICLGAADWNSNKIVENANTSNRQCLFTINGTVPVYYNSNLNQLIADIHPIPIPSGATKVAITNSRAGYLAVREFVVSGDTPTSTIATTGWLQNTANVPVEVTLSGGTANYMVVTFKRDSSGTNYLVYETPISVSVDFS